MNAEISIAERVQKKNFAYRGCIEHQNNASS